MQIYGTLQYISCISVTDSMGFSEKDLRLIENTLAWELQRIASSKSLTVRVGLRSLPREHRRVARRAMILLLRRYRVPFTLRYTTWRTILYVDDARKVRRNWERMREDIPDALRNVAKGLYGIYRNAAVIGDA